MLYTGLVSANIIILWLRAAALQVALAVLCTSKPLVKRWDHFETRHAWSKVPHGWRFYAPAPPDHTLRLTIGLKQAGLDELISTLYEVSDPRHERYGAYLTKEQVERLVAPGPETISLVEDWLAHYDIDPLTVTYSGGRSWLTLDVPVSKAERMLNAAYNIYHSLSSDAYVVRTLSYALPRELRFHVDVVTPTTHIPSMRRMRATSSLQPDHVDKFEFKPGSGETVPSSCGTTITPSCLRTLYNTAGYVPKATDKNQLGVVGYLGNFANYADVQTFFAKFRTDALGSNFTITLVNGGLDDQTQPGVESDLDVQYAEGISFPTSVTYYSTGGSPPFNPDSITPTNTNEPYLDWLNFILAQGTIPQTITMSYGDNEQSVPNDYAKSVCHLFAQLGIRGTSVLFSTGDFGVGGGDCHTNDGKNTTQFQPFFPASCPFVTTVGGTTKVDPEIAANFTGGGFSNYFERPSYQTYAVDTFLDSLGTQFAGLFNATGRAYPDVAAQSKGFQIVVGGIVHSVEGTSAASPTFAGIVSLLNDWRLSNGKTSLGFLNPLIYSKEVASSFNDITSGNIPGCGTAGFNATAGWDPVTGLGTPDFIKLQKVVLSCGS